MYITGAMERLYLLFLGIFLSSGWIAPHAHAHEGAEFNSHLVDFTGGTAAGTYTNTTLTPWGLSTMRKGQPGQYRSAGYRITLTRPLQLQTVAPILYIDNFVEGQVEVSLRFSADSLEWSAWQGLHHHEPWSASDSQLVADPLFVSVDVRFFQFLITFLPTQPGQEPVRVRGIRFDYFTPGNQTVIRPQDLVSHPILGANIAPACNCEPPLFATRTEWGCPDGQSPSCAQPAYAPVTHMIVHHSATPGDATNWAAVVLSIWTYHTLTNGWCDIGYNWLIAPDGVVYEGRGGGNNVRGAHFCGSNTGTMGICMLGTYEDIDPTPQALASLEKLLAWKGCDAALAPMDTTFHPSSGLQLPVIAGHRDGCNTLCPGQHLFDDLAQMRSAVAQTMDACAITSIDMSAPSLGLRVYPNPSQGILTVEVAPATVFEGECRLYDQMGHLVHREELRLPSGTQRFTRSWPHLAQGLYYLQLVSAQQRQSQPVLIRY